MTVVALAVAGALGAYARFRVGGGIARRHPGAFPWGTFVVNLSGAFVLGALNGAHVTGDWLLIAGTGFLGAYTTFSTWMVETIGDAGLVYLFASMAGGLATAGLGWALAAAVF